MIGENAENFAAEQTEPSEIIENVGLTGRPEFDYDSDGDIDSDDAALLVSGNILGGQACQTNKVCDVNADGFLDLSDGVSLSNFYTASSPP